VHSVDPLGVIVCRQLGVSVCRQSWPITRGHVVLKDGTLQFGIKQGLG
jgi:hypothetical protein